MESAAMARKGEYGVASVMTFGPAANAKVTDTLITHPVQKIQLDFDRSQEQIMLTTARRLQVSEQSN
jgi:hypothetical protein